MEIHLLFHRRARSGRTKDARGEWMEANTQMASRPNERKRVEIAWQAWRGIRAFNMRPSDEQMKYIAIFSVVLWLTFSRCSSSFDSSSVLSESLRLILFVRYCCCTVVPLRSPWWRLRLVLRYCWLPPAALYSLLLFWTNARLERSHSTRWCFHVSSFCRCENTKNFYLLIKACSVGICKKAYEKWRVRGWMRRNRDGEREEKTIKKLLAKKKKSLQVRWLTRVCIPNSDIRHWFVLHRLRQQHKQ